ncbi:myb-like protein X [Asterias rubens]|uniref:myb-like protein X n=1 Tax=Asterias rubens TaxID=7604 RepID=UPI0014550B48|nr:myb-like protein X [Asterias rubens]
MEVNQGSADSDTEVAQESGSEDEMKKKQRCEVKPRKKYLPDSGETKRKDARGACRPPEIVRGYKMKILKCFECGQTFWRRWNLNRHIDTHKQEKEKYRCPQCPTPTNFSRFEDLKRHTRHKHLSVEDGSEPKSKREEKQRKDKLKGKEEKKREQEKKHEEERQEKNRERGEQEKKRGGERQEKKREKEEQEKKREEEKQEKIKKENEDEELRKEENKEEGEMQEREEEVVAYDASISLLDEEIESYLVRPQTPVKGPGIGKRLATKQAPSPTSSIRSISSATSSASSSCSSTSSATSSASNSSSFPDSNPLNRNLTHKEVKSVLKGKVIKLIERHTVKFRDHTETWEKEYVLSEE